MARLRQFDGQPDILHNLQQSVQASLQEGTHVRLLPKGSLGPQQQIAPNPTPWNAASADHGDSLRTMKGPRVQKCHF